jgi:hypothetical protein
VLNANSGFVGRARPPAPPPPPPPSNNLGLTRVTNFPVGEYTFRSALGNFMVDTNGGGNGTNVHLWQTVNGHVNQRIRVAHLGNGLYSLQSSSSGRFLDAQGGQTGNGTRIISWQWNGDPNMIWEIYQASDGSYVFMNHRARRVLDVPGGRAHNGNVMQLWDWNGTASQRFWLTGTSSQPQQRTHTIQASNGVAVRTGAGTGNSQVGGIARGSVIRYTQTAQANGFTWALVESGSTFTNGTWGQTTGRWVALL